MTTTKTESPDLAPEPAAAPAAPPPPPDYSAMLAKYRAAVAVMSKPTLDAEMHGLTCLSLRPDPDPDSITLSTLLFVPGPCIVCVWNAPQVPL